MYGKHVDALIVEFKIPNTKWSQLWRKQGDHGDEWRPAFITVKSAGSFVVILPDLHKDT